MALRAMNSAATGMRVNEFNLDNIANNLANAGTTGFKRSRVNFEDLAYQYLKMPGAQDGSGQPTPLGVDVGLGARVSSTEMDQRQGSPLETGKSFDIAIIGEGFFQIQDAAGNTFYTRAGNFTVNSNGQMVLASADSGRFLQPAITIQQGMTDVSILSDGAVTGRLPPATTPVPLGNLQLAQFINPEGLMQLGDNLFGETAASGTANLGTPGATGLGQLKQGSLEASNVEPVRELIDLIKTQRNFEINSQVVQASDQILQLVANLRRI